VEAVAEADILVVSTRICQLSMWAETARDLEGGSVNGEAERIDETLQILGGTY